MPFPYRRKRFPPALNRLSLKIALLVTVFAAATILGMRVASVDLSLGAALAWSLLLGLFTYAAAHVMLARRLNRISTALEQIRQHQFEHLQATRLPHGDELDALTWQLHRTGISMKMEMTELRRMETYRREFLGNVSHELKTPIFAIQGFTETLLDGALEDERVNRSFLDKILRNTTRLNALSRDLSEIARLETGEFRLNVEPFSLRRVAREVTESLEPAANNRQVTLRQNIPENLPPVLGDRERVRQVLLNLVENAVKYNNTGGWVEITGTLAAPGDVTIAVVDSGIGVAEQDIPRLTERFYRVDKSRSRDQGGTGLGLAIVKHILSAHDRSLSIQSELGHGSTFAFTLPVARSVPIGS